jgi:hypothetical protein
VTIYHLARRPVAGARERFYADVTELVDAVVQVRDLDQ